MRIVYIVQTWTHVDTYRTHLPSLPSLTKMKIEQIKRTKVIPPSLNPKSILLTLLSDHRVVVAPFVLNAS